MEKKKTRFLKHIHYFRGFAILNIVFVHTWYTPALDNMVHSPPLIDVSRDVAFHASTLYFIFISGFLFYYLSANFHLMKYYKSKLLNVICPYIFLTSLILISENYFAVISSELSIYLFVKKLIHTIIDGNAKVQYWYIPFISLVFLVSPLLLKIPKPVFKKIVLVACLLPLLGTRTGTRLTLFQYVYFFPTYLLGIYSAMNYDQFVATIRKQRVALIIIALTSTLFLIYYHGKPLEFGLMDFTQSIFYIQKLSLCFLVLLILMYFEDKDIALLSHFATYSFAIYFTHTLVSNGVTKRWYTEAIFHRLPDFVFPLSMIYATFVSLATLLICMILKRFLGRHSRYIIGA